VIDLVAKRMPRGLRFWAFNVALVLFLGLFVVAPMLSHFSDLNDDISEGAAQLSHLQAIVRNARILMSKTPQAGNPFLAGREERLVSADLQANLTTITNAAGVRFLGIRAVQAGRLQQLPMVAVSLELEGPLASIRDVVQAIENQTPFLFVTSAVFRSVPDADENQIRAELTVQGAMKEPNSGDAGVALR
jgi:general secretion pathway protein M